MPTKIKRDIKQRLDELTDTEKMLVLNYLLTELDRPDPEIDKACAKEALRRQKELRSGKTKPITMAQVFSKYKK
jgi:Putative addiction module component